MTCIALITARGGSKGLPGKNLRPLGGKPLIAWTIEAALASDAVERVLVSTDDPEIARVSREAGAEVPFLRPAEISRDDSPHILTSEHALGWLEKNDGVRPEYMMLLQPTSPLRNAADIDAAAELARTTGAQAVASVTEPRHHPLWIYGMDERRTLSPLIKSDLAYRRRQDHPAMYALNGAIYLNRCDALLKDRVYVPAGTVGYVMPPERSIDIDTLLDFEMAEFLHLRLKAGIVETRDCSPDQPTPTNP